jgi:hypothetical protein
MGCKTIGAFSQSGQSFVTQRHVSPWEVRDPYNAVIAFLLSPLGSYCVFVVRIVNTSPTCKVLNSREGKQEECSYAYVNKIYFSNNQSESVQNTFVQNKLNKSIQLVFVNFLFEIYRYISLFAIITL